MGKELSNGKMDPNTMVHILTDASRAKGGLSINQGISTKGTGSMGCNTGKESYATKAVM